MQAKLDARANRRIVVKPSSLTAKGVQLHVTLDHIVSEMVISTWGLCTISVSYTHLTLPTKRIV